MRTATFSRIDSNGDVVILVGGEEVLLPLTNKLIFDLTEARQKREEAGLPPTSSEVSLPLSKIQSLIRSGKTYTQVAEKFSLDEDLVRHFSQSVREEKHYVINQFLSTFYVIGKDKKRIGDILSDAFARENIPFDPESLKWEATRRHHEPWKLTLHFVKNEKKNEAIWSWNLHTNKVECLNRDASLLFGQKPQSPLPEKEETSSYGVISPHALIQDTPEDRILLGLTQEEKNTENPSLLTSQRESNTPNETQKEKTKNRATGPEGE